MLERDSAIVSAIHKKQLFMDLNKWITFPVQAEHKYKPGHPEVVNIRVRLHYTAAMVHKQLFINNEVSSPQSDA
jgi:hypothetical protein